MATTQSLFAPSLLFLFLFVLDWPKQMNIVSFYDSSKNDFKDIMLNYYKIWPGVQLVNFYLVPLQASVTVRQTMLKNNITNNDN
jgi:hypothetical protein